MFISSGFTNVFANVTSENRCENRIKQGLLEYEWGKNAREKYNEYAR